MSMLMKFHKMIIPVNHWKNHYAILLALALQSCPFPPNILTSLNPVCKNLNKLTLCFEYLKASNRFGANCT